MARPRRISDAQLLDAAARAIVASDGAGWTLADAGQACGMSPAALVKRFGSKVGLLRALAIRWADGIPAYEPTDLDPRTRIREWVQEWVRGLTDPFSARGHLVLLVEEMCDDQARWAVVRGRQRQAAFLGAALQDAWLRRLLVIRPAAEVPELWLDLLGGAAVTGAVDESTNALRRAARHIDTQLDEWSPS